MAEQHRIDEQRLTWHCNLKHVYTDAMSARHTSGMLTGSQPLTDAVLSSVYMAVSFLCSTLALQCGM